MRMLAITTMMITIMLKGDGEDQGGRSLRLAFKERRVGGGWGGRGFWIFDFYSRFDFLVDKVLSE